MITDEQMALIEAYVTEFFKKNMSPELTYHDIVHTRAVAKRAAVIASNSQLSEREKRLVITAAWFHDIGYVINKKEHEERSIKMAWDFLKTIGMSEEDFEKISACIRATRFPQNPTDKLSYVMCDADLSHLAHRDFFEISLLFRDELNSLNGYKMSLADYWTETLRIFENHTYHTDYGKKELALRKKENCERLKKMIIQLSKNQREIRE